ncbi:60S ribosomal protein L9 [Rhodosporidiobolus nylandii]
MLSSSSARLATTATAARPACAVCQTQRRYTHKLVEVELTTDMPDLGRRGQRVPVAPGIARNGLVPGGQALYVGRSGEAVSPLQRMLRKEALRAGGLQVLWASELPLPPFRAFAAGQAVGALSDTHPIG